MDDGDPDGEKLGGCDRDEDPDGPDEPFEEEPAADPSWNDPPEDDPPEDGPPVDEPEDGLRG